MSTESLLKELLVRQQSMEEQLQRIVEQLSFGEPTLETKTYKTTELTESLPPSEPVFKEGTYLEVLRGSVLDDPTYREGSRKDGSEWKNAGFRMNVKGQTIRLTLWDSLTFDSQGLVAGDIIEVTNVSVRKPYKEMPQLSSTRRSEFKVIEL